MFTELRAIITRETRFFGEFLVNLVSGTLIPASRLADVFDSRSGIGGRRRLQNELDPQHGTVAQSSCRNHCR